MTDLAKRALAGALVLVLTGCAGATTPPSVVVPLAIDRQAPVQIGSLSLDVETGIWIKDDQRQHLRNRIEAELAKRALMAPAGTAPQAYALNVHLTRFDEGNAVARLALIGLGQVHIEGTVTLRDAAGQKTGEYKIRKTFAAGGLIGGLTSTEAVEDGFAKSVAAGLQPDAAGKDGKAARPEAK